MRRSYWLLACGLAVSIVAVAQADTFTVQQIDFEYSPADITVHQGDIVEWIWSNFDHTVTSGTGPDDPEMGVLFNAPLDAENPTFSRQFNDVGEFPYFCIPHYFLGMTGIVRVQEGTPVEAATWSGVKALYD